MQALLISGPPSRVRMHGAILQSRDFNLRTEIARKIPDQVTLLFNAKKIYDSKSLENGWRAGTLN